MSETVTLEKDDLKVVVSPRLGAAILSVQQAGRNLLRPGTVDSVQADPRNAACFPCVPYFGRLYDGLSFADRHWSQDVTLPAADPSHALHGEGWISEWTIETHKDDMLVCAFRHDGQTPRRYPFPYEAKQSVSLSDGAVKIALSLKNTGDAPMPGGLGLHPYFKRAKDMAISFNAGRYWTPPSSGAKGALAHLPDALGSGRLAPPPATERDHAYAGFAGAATIVSANAAVTLISDAPVLHLYAPEDEPYLCLEPVTHLPGTLTDDTSGYSGAVLGEGETIATTMTLRSAT